jgi:hypothetical protein
MTEPGADPTAVPSKQWSNLFLLMAVAATLMMGGFVALGIPGAVMAWITTPVLELLMGLPQGELTAGSRGWPLVLMLSILFPPGIPISYLLSRKLWPDLRLWRRTLVVLAGTWIWSLLMVVTIVLVG